MAAFDEKVFVVFRSGTTHISYDGRIKVIASEDMSAWHMVSRLEDPDADLRDPMAVVFQDKLFVYYGMRVADKPTRSAALCSADGIIFEDPVCLEGLPEGYWLWFARPFGDTLYGSAYRHKAGCYEAGLYASDDGLRWRSLAQFPVFGATEVSFDFDDEGVLWALVREDATGSVPGICTLKPPYTDVASHVRLPIRLQGPMLKRLEGGCVISARRWDGASRRNLRTDLLWLPDGGEPRFVRSLPSGGDTSYAAWLDLGDNRAVMSYYSSHEHKMDEPHEADSSFEVDSAHAEHSTPADIFLADISYKPGSPD